LEVDRKHAAKMKGLIQCAKEYQYVAELWGNHAHLSEVTDNNSTAREAKQQVNVAQTHTNYQLSMSAEELIGVVNLDEKVNWFHPATHKRYSFSLQMVLLYYLKKQDGHSMIAEVHQEDLCKPTHIIIPQAEEAERMVGMMNKKIAAFLDHMLLEMDFTEEIINFLSRNLVRLLLSAQYQCANGIGTQRCSPHLKMRNTKERLRHLRGRLGLRTSLDY
jgi:hypothetical protein